MRIALCQYAASSRPGDNLSKVVDLLGSCDADLLVFPEMFLSSYGGRMDAAGYRHHTERLVRSCAEEGRDVCVGIPFRTRGGTYSRLVYIEGATGRIHAYDKIHVARFEPYNESFLAGKVPVTVGQKGFVTGLSVCYDVMFPELYREY